MKKINKMSSPVQIDPRSYNDSVELLEQREDELFSQRSVVFPIIFQWQNYSSTSSTGLKRRLQLPFDAILVAADFDVQLQSALGTFTASVSSTDLDDDIDLEAAYDTTDPTTPQQIYDVQVSGSQISSGNDVDVELGGGAGAFFADAAQVTLWFEMDAVDHLSARETLAKIHLGLDDDLTAAAANTMFEAHESNLDKLDATPSASDGVKARTTNVVEWGSSKFVNGMPPLLGGRYLQYLNDFADGWYVDTIDCYTDADVGFDITFKFFSPGAVLLGSVTVAGAGAGTIAHGQITGLGESSTGDGYYIEVTQAGAGAGYAAWGLIHCTSGKGY